MNGKVIKFLRKCGSGEHYATNQLKKIWNETPRNERKRELNLEEVENVKKTFVRH